MTQEESVTRACEILAAAGWTPLPGWGGYVNGAGVGGVDPWRTPRWKSVTMIPPGHPLYGPDTPDEPHEAAAWLVEHARQLRSEPADPLGLAIVDAAPGETGAEAGEGEAAPELVREGIDAVRRDLGHIEAYGNREIDSPAAQEDAIDAEFTEEELDGFDFAALAAPDLGAEILDEGQADPLLLGAATEDFAPDEIKLADNGPGAFIFGDNLEQKRTAAIGVVTQLALERLPRVDYVRLTYLRNFTMGVAEGRWPDDPASRAELEAEETLERRRRMVEAARDEHVNFLIAASREQIDGFNPLEGWP